MSSIRTYYETGRITIDKPMVNSFIFMHENDVTITQFMTVYDHWFALTFDRGIGRYNLCQI